MKTSYSNNHIKAKIQSIGKGGKFFSVSLKDGNKITARIINKDFNNAKNFIIVYDTATKKNKAINVSKIKGVKSGKVGYNF